MVLDNFRRKLRQEAILWRKEGLIRISQYQHLAERYQFNHLETVQSDRFVFILMTVGWMLIGLGIVILVAANWQIWSKEIKLTLLLILFLATNITGFYCWKQPNQHKTSNQKLLGHGLLILAALVLGADIALSAQIFHVGESACEILLAWGFGVLLMAYSLRLASLGILAILLLQMGYWTGLSEWYQQDDFAWVDLVVQHAPLLSVLIFIPLAYWCKSRWIFTLSAIATVTSLQLNLKSFIWIPAVAFTLPPALLWSYDDSLFPRVSFRAFQPIARILALIFFAILFYFLSFGWWWESYGQNLSFSNPFVLLDVIIFSSLAIWQWYYLLSPKSIHQHRQIEPTTIAFASFIIITGLVISWHQNISPIPVIGIIIFNLLLAIFAWGIIRVALELGERSFFWGGMTLLGLQIISRILEYHTD